MKTCVTCKEEKNLETFSLRKTGKPNSECRACSAKRSNDWYYANKQRSLDQRKRHYEENKEETLRKSKERYQIHKERILKRNREINKTPERREKANKRQREWNRKNPERAKEKRNAYDKKYPEKKLARQSVMWAIRLGFMNKPSHCEICGKQTKIEAHHKDYSKPLEVNWYCRLCHMQLHCKDKDELGSTGKLNIELHSSESKEANS